MLFRSKRLLPLRFHLKPHKKRVDVQCFFNSHSDVITLYRPWVCWGGCSRRRRTPPGKRSRWKFACLSLLLCSSALVLRRPPPSIYTIKKQMFAFGARFEYVARPDVSLHKMWRSSIELGLARVELSWHITSHTIIIIIYMLIVFIIILRPSEI